jgi:hypothetical protein
MRLINSACSAHIPIRSQGLVRQRRWGARARALCLRGRLYARCYFCCFPAPRILASTSFNSASSATTGYWLLATGYWYCY